MVLNLLKQVFNYSSNSPEVVCALSPKNHHLILDYLPRGEGLSIIRLDNHSDDSKPCGMSCFAFPCSMYMNDVFSKYAYSNVYWISKNTEFVLSDYKKKTSFKTLNDILSETMNATEERVVLDVDPDIVFDYPTTFSKGSMTNEELKYTVNYILKNKDVQLIFFAAPKEFAQKMLGKKYKSLVETS
ncbi:Uncharacterised protein [Candidatus Tiddalikarchaeum anstoanum]|nr:Uncharacterised protein [Candidatus Tiddalikarchaeum anstoanum]